ncbi:replication protein A 70 kDa DNA-binding subunit B [Artemisia annua]|uniref:Replication protein A 70 kDa DNA-binding subunit B n=1 Tax=Artemisia annua TaxID=35608 RepID=A0A2U1NE40_ARTAN|nr:replication protein A 70 kDa DNA-binding subunit B [Artemisia annua]
MAQFVNGYIKDLSAVKDNVKLRVRVLRAWMQPVYGKPHVNNMELILADEQASNLVLNTRIQGQIRMKQVDTFRHQIEEGKAVTISRYVLGEIQPRYRMVKNELRLSFLANTIVEKYVIGQVITCDDLDCYDKNGKAGKKKPITLLDAEGIEMRCTLWGAFAQQFSDFLQKCDDHSKIIAVLHLAMMKMWDDKQNGSAKWLQRHKDATKVDEMSENTANRISTASRNSTKEDFTTSATMRHIVELLDVPQGNPSVIVGTVCAINEEEGWWFRLQIRVQDATGTCSLSLFNDEVQAIAHRSAYQLCDKYGKVFQDSQ